MCTLSKGCLNQKGGNCMNRFIICLMVLIVCAALAFPMIASACDSPLCLVGSIKLADTGGEPGDWLSASFTAHTLRGQLIAAGAAFGVQEPLYWLQSAEQYIRSNYDYNKGARVNTITSSGGAGSLPCSKPSELHGSFKLI